MRSRTQAPNAINPSDYLFGTPDTTMPGGGFGKGMTIKGSKGIFDKGLYDQFLAMAKNGLDPKVKAMIEGQAGGQIAGGTQAINESFAGSGLSQGSKLAGMTALRSNVGKNTQNALLEGDMNARQTGAGNVFNTLGIGQSGSNAMNQYNMGKYQIDKENEFSWGDAIGGLLGAGGSVAGAGISRKK